MDDKTNIQENNINMFFFFDKIIVLFSLCVNEKIKKET